VQGRSPLLPGADDDAYPSAGTQQHNPVSAFGSGLPQGAVRGYPGTEHWRCKVTRQILRYRCHVGRWADDVLLECARRIVAADPLVEA
jgi:hypothetical protein